jgi:hypothetical protein
MYGMSVYTSFKLNERRQNDIINIISIRYQYESRTLYSNLEYTYFVSVLCDFTYLISLMFSYYRCTFGRGVITIYLIFS